MLTGRDFLCRGQVSYHIQVLYRTLELMGCGADSCCYLVVNSVACYYVPVFADWYKVLAASVPQQWLLLTDRP